MAKRKKERTPDAPTKYKRNPVDARAGIDASKIGFSKEAQRTATQKEIDTFQSTGRSSAMQERLRATRRQPGAPGHALQAKVDARNVERGFRAPPQTDDTPLVQPTAEVAPQGLPIEPNVPLASPELSEPSESVEPSEPSSFDNVQEQITSQLPRPGADIAEKLGFLIQFTPASAGIVGGSLVSGTTKAALGQATSRFPSVFRSAEAFLEKPSAFINKDSINAAKGIFSRKYVITPGKTQVVWNTKSINSLMNGLRSIFKNKTAAALLAVGVIGGTYGIISQGTFMAGQVSDDTVDAIGSLQFAQGELARNDNFDEALAISKYSKEVLKEIDEADSYLDQFNIFKAGDRNMRANLKVMAARERDIQKQLESAQNKTESDITFIETGEVDKVAASARFRKERGR